MKFTVTMKFTVALVTLISLTVLADDPLAKIRTANPSLTPFEQLKKLYDEADRPATYSDFDRIAARVQTRTCAFVTQSSPETAINSVSFPAVLDYVVTPANPGNGPLFPPTSATTKPLLMYIFRITADSSLLQQQADEDRVTNSTSATDLIYQYSVPNEVGTSFLRVKGPYIVFMEYHGTPSDPKNVFVYGYCWKL
jgi:hypothetical protein